MTPKEQLRFLLRHATSKAHAQQIAKEFMLQQKIKEAQQKREVDPVTQADLMMKKYGSVCLMHYIMYYICILSIW